MSNPATVVTAGKPSLDFAGQLGKLAQLPFDSVAQAVALVSTKSATAEQLAIWLSLRDAALAAARPAVVRPLSCRISEKGAVSVYGLNARFPVTLYADQWQRLIDFVPALTEFLDKNRAALKSKS